MQNVAAVSASIFVASIPSPSSSTIEIGPISIHFYGLTLLVAIAAAVAITGVRWTRRGGDWDLVFRVAVWGVAFGIVGARAYHVLTSWDELPDEWWGPFAIWKGGLGVWGGIGLGALVGAIVARRSGVSVAALADCAAPALLGVDALRGAFSVPDPSRAVFADVVFGLPLGVSALFLYDFVCWLRLDARERELAAAA